MNNVPQWIVASLGKMVVLAHDIEGPCEHYGKGHPCKLLSIQHSDKGLYVTVAPDPRDEGYEESIDLDDIAPIRH